MVSSAILKIIKKAEIFFTKIDQLDICKKYIAAA
jgi:hypothetical protein